MAQIAIFRSCLRKEYRDQVIKMLRALPGEYTRTAFRRKWVDPKVLELIRSEPEISIISFLVNRDLSLAWPCRKMRLASLPLEDELNDTVRFTFELGNYVRVHQDFDPKLENWSEVASRPPEMFVTEAHPTWTDFELVEDVRSYSDWKKCIDFLVKGWETFENTVFFRPEGSALTGVPSGTETVSTQLQVESFNFASYNPHFSDDQLSRRRIHVSVANLLAEQGSIPKIPRDGFFEIQTRFLESGRASVQVEIRPDEQFSSYVPISVLVSPGSNVDPAGPRILGEAWSNFLLEISEQFSQDQYQLTRLLERLLVVFPGDPEVMLLRGRLHLLAHEWGAARDEFLKVLRLRQDARAGWWSFLAALRSGDLHGAQLLMERLDLSQQELFEEALGHMELLTDEVVMHFAEVPGIGLSEDKATRLLLAMLQVDRSEASIVAVIQALEELNPVLALDTALDWRARRPEWNLLRDVLVAMARKHRISAGVLVDPERMLEWNGQVPSEFLDEVVMVKDFVAPYKRPSLLLISAIRLTTSEELSAVRAGLDVAVLALTEASHIGDLHTMQEAIHLLESVATRLDDRRYRDLVRECSEEIARRLRENPLVSLLDDRLNGASEDLRTFLSDRDLVFFGLNRAHSEIDELRRELGARSLEVLSGDDSSDQSRLLLICQQQTILVVIHEARARVSELIMNQLRARGVSVVFASPDKHSLLKILKFVGESESKEPDFLPSSCRAAFDWASANLFHVVFSPGADSRIDELDRHPTAEKIALRIVRDLRLLDRYAKEVKDGKATSNFKLWGQLEGLTDDQFAEKESDLSKVTKAQRTFTVDPIVDPSGRAFMQSHFRLPKDKSVAPRMHVYLESIAKIGKVYVGYIGPHLDLPK